MQGEAEGEVEGWTVHGRVRWDHEGRDERCNVWCRGEACDARICGSSGGGGGGELEGAINNMLHGGAERCETRAMIGSCARGTFVRMRESGMGGF
jgi:hypothetical protein